MKRRILLGCASVVALVLCASAGPASSVRSPESYADGKALVRAMHDRYAGSWYKTLTFVQTTTTYNPDGTTKAETWHEAMACPGKLRIDFLPLADANGILFADDAATQVEKGEVKDSHPLVHPLMVLGFDVYCSPPETTIARLEKLGFDLASIRDDAYEGVPCYVVGAKAGDKHTAQFWIEKERLLFVRMLRPSGQDGTHTSDVIFDKYQKAGGGWVAAFVAFMLDGTLKTSEEYADIRADVKLPDGLFDPKRWREVHWRS